MQPPFVHLHVHSSYSMMRGVNPVEALCRAAVDAGFEYLALTDTNGFYGLIRFLQAARRYGIRPIVGMHLQSAKASAVVLAKTHRGYELLSELASARHLEEHFSLIDSFPHAPDDLAVLSGKAEILLALRDRADCWVELVPGLAQREALKIARELELPPVATNAVYFAHPEDYPLHRLVRAIDLNRTLSTLDPGDTVPPGQWLKSADEMAKHFPHCPEGLENTLRLARSCHTDWDHFPTVFPYYQDKNDDHFAVLLERCRRGMVWRYGEATAVIEERLAEELELIRDKGYVDYFLVVADIVGRRSIHCGRGSAAASLVSYLLGITHVDPLRHRLLFSRFLNPERKDHPDIDVDFPWDERDGLHEEIRDSYGDERMAAVSNHVGFGARAAVREVAKVYGLPAADIKEVTRRLSYWTDPQKIPERVERHPKFKGFALDPPWAEILHWAGCLEALPRHLSVHCGGVVLAPGRISRHVPVQGSAKGVKIIQWEKDQAEEAGLVKIDLLGNRSLAVIRDALAAVARNTGKTIDYPNFNPVDDAATQELLRRGDSMGVFYVESPAMRQLQQKTGRGDFEHLVIHSSIIRPAANRYINHYIRRLHGEPYKPIHPALEELLSETYGILVYQEDVVQVAMRLAGFSWAEGDRLRKVISKKSSEELTSFLQCFHDGCRERGVAPEIIEEVWGMFLSFAGYSFCKPHSASYALVSFKSAYLKVYYPAEFMAAVISNGGGYYCTLAYVSEARRLGLTVLGPDVNASDWAYRGEGKTIRVGLQQLQNVRRETLEGILSDRQRRGPFTSLEDLLRRVSIPPAEGPLLVKSGMLDSLAGELNRPQLLWFVEAALHGRSPGQRQGSRGQLSAFAPARRRMAVPPLPDLASQQKWRQEYDSLGLVLSVHPLKLWEPAIRALPQRIVLAADLDRQVGRRVWVLGWPITRKEVLTREGESMEFVSFEDTTAIYETIFFPQAYRKFCQEVDMHRAYLLYGQVGSEFGAVSLQVQRVQRLTSATAARGQTYTLHGSA
jgi:DNA-directed DNA polymerase III PolC